MITVETKVKTHYIPNPCSLSIAKDGITVVTPAGREVFPLGDIEAVHIGDEAFQVAESRMAEFSPEKK